MPISELLIIIITGLVMVAALAVTIVPVLPGRTLILLAAGGPRPADWIRRERRQVAGRDGGIGHSFKGHPGCG